MYSPEGDIAGTWWSCTRLIQIHTTRGGGGSSSSSIGYSNVQSAAASERSRSRRRDGSPSTLSSVSSTSGPLLRPLQFVVGLLDEGRVHIDAYH